jgi:hypothetical protein
MDFHPNAFRLQADYFANTAIKAAPFGRWTLRDKAPRSAPYLQR